MPEYFLRFCNVDAVSCASVFVLPVTILPSCGGLEHRHLANSASVPASAGEPSSGLFCLRAVRPCTRCFRVQGTHNSFSFCHSEAPAQKMRREPGGAGGRVTAAHLGPQVPRIQAWSALCSIITFKRFLLDGIFPPLAYPSLCLLLPLLPLFHNHFTEI